MATSTRDSKQQRQRAQHRAQAAHGPNGHHHGQIVSHAPGRMRVRLHQEHRDPAALAKLEQDLGSRGGVAAVETNARTGSVLVHYNHHAVSKEDLTEMMWDAGIVVREMLGAEDVPEDLGRGDDGRRVAEHSTTANSVLDALTDFDYRLSQLTNGKLDVKLLVPLSLGALAVRQIAMNGLGLGMVPGYVLLWYTFDSFYKLHQRKAVATIEAAAEQILGSDADGAAGEGTRSSPPTGGSER